MPELITQFTSGGVNPSEVNDIIKMVSDGAILRFCDLLESEEAEASIRICHLRAIPVKSLGIATAIRNALSYANINTVGQVIDAEDRDLLRIRNFGKKSLMELRAVISRL